MVKDWSDDPLHHEQMESWQIGWNESSIVYHHERLIWRCIAPWELNSIPPWKIDLTMHCTMSRCSHGRLAGMSSMGPPWRIDLTIHCTMSRCSHGRLAGMRAQWVHHEGLIWWSIAPWADTLNTELHIAPQYRLKVIWTQYIAQCHITRKTMWWVHC